MAAKLLLTPMQRRALRLTWKGRSTFIIDQKEAFFGWDASMLDVIYELPRLVELGFFFREELEEGRWLYSLSPKGKFEKD